MTNLETITNAAGTLRAAVNHAGRGLVDRAALVDTIVLAAVAREHVLVIGPPGTAKSEAARRVAGAVGGRYFEYLLGRFTEPSEIFGPVDLRKLRDGVVETETDGMLPEAEIAFLDEIFLGSSAILNTLLGILNERVFRRGHTRMICPLHICIGASNALPEDDSLAAFADRFLVRAFIDPIADPQIEELLAGGWGLAADDAAPPLSASLSDLATLSDAVSAVDMAEARAALGGAIRLLRRAGIVISDRRAVKVQRLIAAAAVLDGRLAATAADLWPIITAVPTQAEQALARDTLRDLLGATKNAVLIAAAEEASLGPLARAARIAESGRTLLDAPPEDGTAGDERLAWTLRLEGVAREIDATFSAETMPQAVREIRDRIVAAIKSNDGIA